MKLIIFKSHIHYILTQVFHYKLAQKRQNLKEFLSDIPEWKTYLARFCISSAGQVGGDVSFGPLFSLNVNSNPNPLGPSSPVTLEITDSHINDSMFEKKTKNHKIEGKSYINNKTQVNNHE